MYARIADCPEANRTVEHVEQSSCTTHSKDTYCEDSELYDASRPKVQ